MDSGVNSAVVELAFDGSGDLYAGGTFTVAGGNPANYIANWDGTASTSTGTEALPSAYALEPISPNPFNPQATIG